MLLYNSAVSGNCYKVRLLLAQLGMQFETREVSVVDRSNREEILSGLNPTLRVPTLVLDDGRPLAESNAILWYFAELHSKLLPTDGYLRAQVLQWMFFEQYEHEPAIAVSRFLASYSGSPEAHQQRVKDLQPAGYKALGVLNKQLEKSNFLVGDNYSIADISLYAYTHVAHEGGFDLDRYSAVRAWLARVAAQAGHVSIDH